MYTKLNCNHEHTCSPITHYKYQTNSTKALVADSHSAVLKMQQFLHISHKKCAHVRDCIKSMV